MSGIASNSIDEYLSLLGLLNVKYIVSGAVLNGDYLDLVLEEDGTRLYRLKDFMPRAFVSKELNPLRIERGIDVQVIDYSSGHTVFKVNMPHNGFLLFSENNYPGWVAYVNGNKRLIKPFLLIQAVALDKGENEVKFIYEG